MAAKNQALNDLLQAQEASRSRKDVGATLPDKYDKFNRASQVLEGLLKNAEGNENMVPLFKRPQSGFKEAFAKYRN